MSRRSKKNRPQENRNPRRREKSIHKTADRLRYEWGRISCNLQAKQPKTINPYLAMGVCVFLLLAVILVFGQTVCHGFVNYDDDLYVYDNPQVEHGLTIQGITWAFTSNHAFNWHPLTWISHMLDCQLYGLSPGGHHLTNVLLHAATAIILFLVLCRMSGDLWPSAFVAAVFAIHPLRVESVAWVTERKDILSGLFFMLTLWAYVSYARRPFSLIRYLIMTVCFALGLMAKPMLVTLPFVLLLLDYWPLGQMAALAMENRPVSESRPMGRFSIIARLAMEKIPLLVLAAALCVITLWAQSKTILANEHVSLILRMSNAAVSYVAYLGKMFYPVELAVLYPFPNLGLPMWKVVAALLVLVAICFGVVALRRKCPYLLVGWLWYMGMLVPVIGLVQVGLQAMADRYTYLPQIGLYIVIAWGVRQLTQLWSYRGWACGIASALVVAVLMHRSWQQTSYWSDSKTLWTHALACTSQNFMAHYNLGLMFFQAGQLPEAIEHYEKAIQIKPDYFEAHNNLGLALANSGRLHEAIKHYQQALLLKPDYFEAYNNLGLALSDAGRLPEAIEQYHKALRLKPADHEIHVNLGIALRDSGQMQEAISHFEKALLHMPNLAEAYGNMALTYAKMNQSSKAITMARKALDLARSKGQSVQAKQIEDWLNSYQSSLPGGKNALPPPASGRTP